MRPGSLLSVGEALYGPRWQSELARQLGVTPRTVFRWLADDAYPDDLADRLRPIVRARVLALHCARKLLWSARGDL